MAGFNIRTAAFAPFLVKAGLLRIADLTGLDISIPDNWYNESAELATAQSSASTTGITLTAAQMLNQIFLRSAANAAQTDTTPTAAALVAAIPGIVINRGLYWSYRNASSNSITLGAGSGITLAADNTNTIASNACRHFFLVFTNVTPGSEAVTIYSMGASAF